ncbi:MAG: SDR family NAD(P)-dependent oxidoreductase [Bacteroidales bacterium]|nr:SDR family NAD(P)-dependent oxidoreductase [Bacteroidales bacterium]
MNNKPYEYTGLEIAIIGMAGRFPMANNIKEFWNNISQGRECITFFNKDEIVGDGDLINNPNYVRAKGIIDNIEYFDNSFFDYFPKEVEAMDPQMRVFHECLWEAFEDSGHIPDRYPGSIGIFAGATANFQWIFSSLIDRSGDNTEQVAASLFSNRDYLCTRLSYQFNLKGPSVLVDTACSTSLVAIHQACRALLTGECSVAVAGGVTVTTPQKTGYLYQPGMITSSDGHCRPFDKDAKGTVPGEGVGVVVLKPLKKAIADGDNIHAIIKGSALNNDGNEKIGFTAPSVDGQEQVIKKAHLFSKVKPNTISYIETHGTGTNLGDPIEIEALNLAFKDIPKHSCKIGSVKSNIGHLDSAAGVASLIKTVLALKNKMLPPSINYQKPNPKINFENSPFIVNTELIRWKSDHTPLRAGVSSFGVGGTNAHVILEEYISPVEKETEKESNNTYLLTLSAKTQLALDEATQNLKSYLNQNECELKNVAYTLQVGRKQFPYRRTLVCNSIDEASKLLDQQQFTSGVENENNKLLYLFSANIFGRNTLAYNLYENEPLLKTNFDKCFTICNNILDYNIKDHVFPNDNYNDVNAGVEKDTLSTFIIKYSLANTWLEYGIKPYAMAGSHIGGFVVGCLAQVFSLEEILPVIAKYAKLLQTLANIDELPFLCDNKEKTYIIPDKYLLLIREIFNNERNIKTLKTTEIDNSVLILIKELIQTISKTKLSQPKIAFYSCTTSDWITNEEAVNNKYWVDLLINNLTYKNNFQRITDSKNHLFLEIGTLGNLSLQIRNDFKGIILETLFSDIETGTKEYYTKLGWLWLNNININWEKFNEQRKGKKITLPTYPFQRKHFPINNELFSKLPQSGKEFSITSEKNHHNIKEHDIIHDWFYTPLWKESSLNVISPNSLQDDSIIFYNENELSKSFINSFLVEYPNTCTIKNTGKYEKIGEKAFNLNIENYDDFVQVFKNLNLKKNFNIITLFNTYSIRDHKLQNSDGIKQSSFYSFLYIAKAIGSLQLNQPVGLYNISNNMCNVINNEGTDFEKSLSLGICSVIENEFPNIVCKTIDFDQDEYLQINNNSLIDCLINEICNPEKIKIVALRQSKRFIRDVKKLNIDNHNSIRLKNNGVYVITGGLGGIGLTICEHLAQKSGCTFVLTTRSAFPERKEWDAILVNKNSTDKITFKINALKKIEQSGSKVLINKCDVSNYQDMKLMFENIKKEHGSINGVIHSAGIADGGLIRARTKDLSEKVLSPKFEGTLILDELIDKNECDFIVLFSSLASIEAHIGEVAYCAGNTFLDYYANYKNCNSKVHYLSINWDGWNEVGMAVDSAKDLAEKFNLKNNNNLKDIAIKPVQGKQIFDIAFSSKLSQIAISSKSLIGNKENTTEPNKKAEIQSHETEKQLTHFYFNKVVTNNNATVTYYATLSLKNCWVLKEHIIKNIHIFPGTGYIDIVYQAFVDLTKSYVNEINDLVFLNPLTINENEEKNVSVILKKSNKYFDFKIISTNRQSNNSPIIHATGKIKKLNPGQNEQEKFNIQNIIDAYKLKENDINSSNYIEFGKRWQNLEKVYTSQNTGLVKLKLSANFENDIKDTKLHPALLDCASGFMIDYIEGNYIPYSYHSIKIFKRIPAEMHSFIQVDKRSRGSVSFSGSIFDYSGDEIIRVKDYALKEISEKGEFVENHNNYALHSNQLGLIDNLTFKITSRRIIACNEIEIEVYYTGMNFKDVLLALNLIPGQTLEEVCEEIGAECSGKVISIGKDITQFKVGDEVFAMAPACFSQFITVKEDFVRKKPGHLSLKESATLLCAYTTAYYSLVKLGRLRKDEKVLIHSAAGGVGLAAVGIAQHIGAEIIATTGTKEKKDFLYSQGLQKVMDSRSSLYLKELKSKDIEIDVLLNSLGGGDFLDANLSVLGTYGRYLDIGKRDIAEHKALNLGYFEKSLSYFAISLGTDNPMLSEVIDEIIELIKQKKIKSIPYSEFRIDNIHQAFDFMSKAKHIGKLIIAHKDDNGNTILTKEKLKTLANQHKINANNETKSKKSYSESDKHLNTDYSNNQLVNNENTVNVQDAKKEQIKENLIRIFNDILGNINMNPEDDFFDIGIESLTLVQMHTRINELYKNVVSVQDLFSASSVNRLTDRIFSKLNPEQNIGNSGNLIDF